MAFARRQMNATLLADGSVLVTGGTSGPGFNNQASAVRAAELWNPRTETWTTMASGEQLDRTYHGTAVLLPSGQVLSSGSGEGGGITYANSEFSAQVFNPPYLLQCRWQPGGAAEHYFGAFHAFIRPVVYGPDPGCSIGHAGDSDPAVLRHPRIQHEPAHLSSDLRGDRRYDA